MENLQTEGLRHRKKQRTRELILAEARRLFEARGLDGTTMEDIAGAAEVSVGTLYNYFGSKSTLLLALFNEWMASMTASSAGVLADPGDDPVQAVKALFDVYLDFLLDLDRRLLQDVFVAGMSGHSISGELMAMDVRLMVELGGLLAGFRKRGLAGSSVPLEEATMLLYSVLIMQLFMFVMVGAIQSEDVRAATARQVEAAFHGMAER